MSYRLTHIRRKLDPDYASGLEDQIMMLREEVRRLENLNAFVPILDEDNPLGQQQSHARSDDAAAIPPNMATAIEDVSALMWRLSIGSSGEESFIGPSGNFCFPIAYCDDPDVRVEKTTATSSPGLAPGMELLWSDQANMSSVIHHLLDRFSQLINPIHQFLDGETLDQIHGNNLSPGLRLVKTAVVAAGALFSDDANGKAFGDEAAAVVDAVALQLCRQSPSISTIQTLSIMCWRELGLEQHNMAWMYNSMCASLALHLGLPVSASEDIGLSSPEHDTLFRESRVRDVRLRSLWSSVFMDRIATSLLGRTCMLPWKRIKAHSFISSIGPSPSLDELAFDHQCRLWFIHDQYMDRIYSFDFSELSNTDKSRILLDARDQLYSFRRQLHPQVQLDRNSINPSMIYLHMSYHMSHILIHRPYLKGAAQSDMYKLCVWSMSSAASSIVRLLREYRKVAPLDQISPFAVHSVLTAAVTHLCNATSTHQTLRSQSIAWFRVCFDALRAMQQRWIKAKRGIRLLQELARRWQVMVALPLQHGFPPLSDPAWETLEEMPELELPPNAGYDGNETGIPVIFPDIFNQASMDPFDMAFYQENLFSEAC
ncbi:hypothetical protein BO94DRAFT_584301 [Aspergillus sclerotioniger CBS 115572]|uniref:Xylanolytic transcriptional activator regulatory domain-containing protein n=1 Tax=Aspergillus sclerotioniger CBS 115572 TaxID=1450535 RepID=A0A317WZY6_9EURO|nr:hypothetical protein BO94DRAFT_584301 [Aspergillus sclerotioniger CBS 115572]PWY90288.1 hypothetical protein BO94DRAFT_584301 [Aspergillus sclerotioniger CBS 115572]